MKIKCRSCQCEIESEPVIVAGREIPLNRYCQQCAVRFTAETDAKAAGDRRDRLDVDWREICPPLFRNTLVTSLPHKGLYAAVMAWEYGWRGLMIAGASALGKTRCAYELLKREHYAGRKVKAINAADIVRYPIQLMDNSAKANAWLTSCTDCALLLLDDIFKVKLTERVEEALFIIVEERTANCRPMIVTTNDTRTSILSRVSPDRGEALVRRIIEFTQEVHP